MPACTRSFFVAIPLGFLAALAALMGLVYFQLGAPTALSHWCSEIIRVKQETANSTRSPKLVLLGGSATLFGIKASIIEKELGVPTLNAGTHAGLGSAYILQRGKRFLSPGDTVVLVPEFEVLIHGERNRRVWASLMYVDYILSRDPAYYRALPLLDQVEIALMTTFKRLTKGIACRSEPEKLIEFDVYYTYDPALVDSHGDMTGHLAERRPANCPPRDLGICLQLLGGLPGDSPGFPLLAAFCKWAAENQVRVLATFPNMVHRPAYDLPIALAVEKQIRDFFAGLGVPVVGSLHDALMPPSDFFDTNYHPTEEASVQRSLRFAEQLRPWFTQPAPPPSNR